MQYYLKMAKSLSIPLLLVLIVMFVNNSDNTVSFSPIIIAKHAKATVTVSPSYSDNSDIATITKIQLPGIIPNINNNNNNASSPSATPSPSGSAASNAASNNPQPSAPPSLPPIVHRNTRARPAIGGPTLNDPNLKVEQIINRGFNDPTSMAFLGPNDILVLGKNTGIVHRILNGKILPEPLLDVNVANEAERVLLGIAIAKSSKNKNENTNVNTNTIRHAFLYYTESGGLN